MYIYIRAYEKIKLNNSFCLYIYCFNSEYLYFYRIDEKQKEKKYAPNIYRL